MTTELSIQKISEIIEERHALDSRYIVRDGFVFTTLTHDNVFDALVVKKYNEDILLEDGNLVKARSISECVELINQLDLKSAVFIVNDSSVLKQCPMLEHFTLYPDQDDSAGLKYHLSMNVPGIRQFSADKKSGIDEIYIGVKSPLYFQRLKTLKHLNLWGFDEKTNDTKRSVRSIEDFELPNLRKLSIQQCRLSSLKGIQGCPRLQWLDLSYMRSLEDISDLSGIAPSIRALFFENCPSITDFSVISQLKELEYLDLMGKNQLLSLDFIKELPKLKYLRMNMTVLDGDISCLKNIQYTDVVCKRHYNLKSKDLPKDRTDLGFEFT